MGSKIFIYVAFAWYLLSGSTFAEGFLGGSSMLSFDRIFRGSSQSLKKDIRSNTQYQKKGSTLNEVFSFSRRYLASVVDVAPIPSLVTLLEDGPIPVADREFKIHGWRWHTASVIRDLNRFEKVLLESKRRQWDVSEMASVKHRIMKCYSFVFDFNWKACMKVETELFLPWLKTLLPSSSNHFFNDIYERHERIKMLSNSLKKTCTELCCDDKKNYRVALGLLHELKDCALFIQNAQERVFVPFISAYVSKMDQEKFNNKVIRHLGVLDSQVHIVSMKEAINGDQNEERLFKDQIPFVARKLLPVWRERLYKPRTKWLDHCNYSDASFLVLRGGVVDSFDDSYADDNGDVEINPLMQIAEREFIKKYFPDLE